LYGDDRLFVAAGEHPGLSALEDAGHPVVRLPGAGPADLGAEMFRWMFATAVAGHVLKLNPFDQPNVEEAKKASAEVLKGRPAFASTPPLAEVLSTVQSGDYIAILAYLPRSPELAARL